MESKCTAAMWLLHFSFSLLVFSSAYGNYFFVTHSNYTTSSLTASVLSSTTIAGNLETVTQQCRRNCARNPLCAAFHVAVLQNTSNLGVFNCSFFARNACNSNQTSLTTNSAVNKLWDKLDAKEFKPKPCIEHCGVKFKWNCKACRGNAIFRGFDCEIAPRVCSEYPTITFYDTWMVLPVWPWGIYRPSVKVWCRNTYETTLIFSYTPERVLRASFLSGMEIKTTDFNHHIDSFNLINWPLMSELQGFAKNKILNLYMDSSKFVPTNPLKFGGFELSPLGELSLNSSLNGSTGFPVPLDKAPFVLRPPGYGYYCGPFWQFEPSVPVCQQRTNLLKFQKIKWETTLLTLVLQP